MFEQFEWLTDNNEILVSKDIFIIYFAFNLLYTLFSNMTFHVDNMYTSFKMNDCHLTHWIEPRFSITRMMLPIAEPKPHTRLRMQDHSIGRTIEQGQEELEAIVLSYHGCEFLRLVHRLKVVSGEDNCTIPFASMGCRLTDSKHWFPFWSRLRWMARMARNATIWGYPFWRRKFDRPWWRSGNGRSGHG